MQSQLMSNPEHYGDGSVYQAASTDELVNRKSLYPRYKKEFTQIDIIDLSHEEPLWP